ncbi:MAG: mechanosensitive ion channel family protein, partial [Desulfobacteraceae bacterium]|nr:mechanosensitive ion channel family protein [Desulfobacteraceae bacterium]
WLKIKESLAYKIKEIVEGAGSSFAYPSSSIYIESLPTEQPELFIPPTPDSD